jgi:UDP-glucose 4-epimerase
MTAVQRVLVTGAGGFVGRNIVQTLLDAGHHVLVLDRHFDSDIEPAWAGNTSGVVELISADVENLPAVAVDDVVHGAAITASPEEIGVTPEEHYRANLDAVLYVLEWSRRQGVRRTVVISSGAVYRATAPGPVDEQMPTSPMGLYAVAKDAAEKLVETLRAEYGRDVISVRLSNIYGPYERTRASRPRISLVAKMVQAALDQGKLVVYREAPALDWTYAPDVGRAVERLLAARELCHHLYHAASEERLTALDIARAIKAVLPHIELDVRDGREPGGKPRSRLGYLSSERLRTELGFDQWTPFEQGLRNVIAWLQTEKVS